MAPMPKLDREAFVTAMRQKLDAVMGQVADAINNARDGYIIAESECKVRDLFAELRQEAYQLGLQGRIDAAQAAFPPSGGRDGSQDAE